MQTATADYCIKDRFDTPVIGIYVFTNHKPTPITINTNAM